MLNLPKNVSRTVSHLSQALVFGWDKPWDKIAVCPTFCPTKNPWDKNELSDCKSSGKPLSHRGTNGGTKRSFLGANKNCPTTPPPFRGGGWDNVRDKTMGKLRYLVIQIVPGAHPRGAGINANFLTGDGVLVSAMTDGFYMHQSDAEDVAAHLATERPNLETYVVAVVKKGTADA